MVGGFIDKTPWNGELVKGDLPDMDLPPKNKVRKKDLALTNGESVEGNSPAIDLLTDTKNGSALNDNASQTTCKELYLADQIVLPSNDTTDADQDVSIKWKFSGNSGVMNDIDSEDLPSIKWKFSGVSGVTIDDNSEDLPSLLLLQDYEFYDIEYEHDDSDDKSPMARLMASEGRQDDNPASDDDSDHGMPGMISREKNEHDLDDQLEQSHGYAMAEKMQTGVIRTVEVAEEFTILADDTNDPKLWLALGLKWMSDLHLDNDISMLLCFCWYEPVYYKEYETSFPSESREGRGRFVGVSEHVGHAMTFKILTDDTGEIIFRSEIRSALDPKTTNLRLDDVFDGENATEFITTMRDNIRKAVRDDIRQAGENSNSGVKDLSEMEPHGETQDGETQDGETQDGETQDGETQHGATPPGETQHGATPPGETQHGATPPGETPPGETPQEGTQPHQFHPSDLVGRTFLMNEQEDGQRFRARIVEAIEQHENEHAKESELQQFRVSVNEDQYQEILSYNNILNFIEQKENNEETLWKFKRIVGHQGPLNSSDHSYNGSGWNVMMEWESGEITTEPLITIAADDPVTCAIYARDNDLLEEPGWKRFRGIARRDKKMVRQVNQAKFRSFQSAPKYQYGYKVPRDYDHAVTLDQRNGNTHWQDSTKFEMEQLDEYDTFIDRGHKDVATAPKDYKKIRVHLVFMVKHDGRHKSRLVADGHLTDVPVESVYFGVVSLRGLRMMIFLAELNGLEAWATDIGNAYFEAAKTAETGRAVTGILDFVHGTPLDWYFKKQATVETATYGSEFHRVREAVAMKIIGYYHIRSETNPSDVLSKHWGYSQVWPLLRCVLFWRGDTALLLTEQEEQEEQEG
jgi:hypothetical protein